MTPQELRKIISAHIEQNNNKDATEKILLLFEQLYDEQRKKYAKELKEYIEGEEGLKTIPDKQLNNGNKKDEKKDNSEQNELWEVVYALLEDEKFKVYNGQFAADGFSQYEFVRELKSKFNISLKQSGKE